jgi:tRNA(His) 5'-end guanylyltransferase
LRKEGVSAEEAQKMMSGVSNSKKNEILFQRGINYNYLPLWQKRGIGMYFKNEVREGYNPVTKEATQYTRHSLHIEMDLPIGSEYSALIEAIVMSIYILGDYFLLKNSRT